jgi:hypothetical protein
VHVDRLGAENLPVAVKDLGFAFEGENERPPYRNYAQRLVGGIQDKRSSQGEWKYMAAYLEDCSSPPSPGTSLDSVGTQTLESWVSSEPV